MPVALGFKFIVSFFYSFHSPFYYLGALFLIFMGLMTFLEVKMPFNINLSVRPNKNLNIASVYTLGIISGITSSCCAPVLLAAITLTSLSPTLFQAVFVSAAYILGMVFPLFVLSFAYEWASGKVIAESRQKIYHLFKILGSAIFVTSGLIIAVLNYQGKIVMGGTSGESARVRIFIFNLSKHFSNPVVDLAAFGFIIVVFYLMIRKKGVSAR